MELRFPATTPRVSRSAMIGPKDVVLIDGGQFDDGLRRLVVGSEVSDESIDVLKRALSEIDYRDGATRWIQDMLAGTKPTVQDHPNGSGA